jgi:hypothetical protein
MDSPKDPILDAQVTSRASWKDHKREKIAFSRRVFCSGAACALAAASMERFVFAQEAERPQRPTPSDGPPPCDGVCHVYPVILIPNGPNDDGHRSTDPNDHSLGVQSPNVWFEDVKTGQIVNALIPGQHYQIVAQVANIGSGPTFSLCVDFMVWTSTDNVHNTNIYTMVSTKQGQALMQNDSIPVRSEPWSPAFGMGLKPGDAIVRAYDPWADHYTQTGEYLFVNRDRHLAHKPYS